MDNSVSSILGCFWGGTLRYCLTFTSGKNQLEKKWGGPHSNVLVDLGRPHYCCWQCPSAYPNQWVYSSAELNWWPHLAREVRCQICLAWIHSWQFVLSRKHTLETHMNREARQWPRPTTKHSFQPWQTRKSGRRCQTTSQHIYRLSLDRGASHWPCPTAKDMLQPYLTRKAGQRHKEALQHILCPTRVGKEVSNTTHLLRQAGRGNCFFKYADNNASKHDQEGSGTHDATKGN